MLFVGGTAGQVVVLHFEQEDKEVDIKVRLQPYHLFSLYCFSCPCHPTGVGERNYVFGLSVRRVRSFVLPFVRADTVTTVFHGGLEQF